VSRLLYWGPLVAIVAVACSPEVQLVKEKNVAPTAIITTPTSGSVFGNIDTIEFVGTVADQNDNILSVIWTSDLEGELETVVPDEQGSVRLNRALTPGVHSIELRVVDDEGLEAAVAVSVDVQSAVVMPNAQILNPEDNGNYVSGNDMDLAGTVSDPQQAPETLSLFWAYEPGNGGQRTIIDNSQAETDGTTGTTWVDHEPGSWKIILEVTDEDGNIFEDHVFVIVEDPAAADQDGDGFVGADDCNDMDNGVNPDANEVCNNEDTDCSDQVDDKDTDNDGHIDMDCTYYVGAAPLDDCDDDNPFVYTGAVEQPDGADNNCDGFIDEGSNLFDGDGDCYCEHPSICNDTIAPLVCYLLLFDDCDDTDPVLNPRDADGDGESSCEGDCDDNDQYMNDISDWDGDGFTTCDGDCNDYDPLLTPLTCP